MLCGGRPVVLGRLRPRQVARGLAAAGGQQEVPPDAEVVVVGGGAVATSTAFHLARGGAGRGVLLLEAEKLTAGTTWHSAAMVNSLRFGIVEAKLVNHTKQLIGQLEEETGVSPGYKVHGGLTVTTKPDHMDQFRWVCFLLIIIVTF
jgi:glycine/D-amino acid oxidase-like deaminating enzyme